MNQDGALFTVMGYNIGWSTDKNLVLDIQGGQDKDGQKVQLYNNKNTKGDRSNQDFDIIYTSSKMSASKDFGKL